jgi:hypothetical protein
MANKPTTYIYDMGAFSPFAVVIARGFGIVFGLSVPGLACSTFEHCTSRNNESQG